MFCPQCGASIQEGNRFCTTCGAAIPETVADTPTTTVSDESPRSIPDERADTSTAGVDVMADSPTTDFSPAGSTFADEVFPQQAPDSCTTSIPAQPAAFSPSTPVAFVAPEGAVPADSGRLSQNKPLIVVLVGALAAVAIVALGFFLNPGDSQTAYGDEIDVATETRFLPEDEDGELLSGYQVTIEPADNRTQTVTYIPLNVDSNEGFTVQDVVNVQAENSMTYGRYRLYVADRSGKLQYSVDINIVDPNAGSEETGSAGDTGGTGDTGTSTTSGSSDDGSDPEIASPPAEVSLTPEKNGVSSSSTTESSEASSTASGSVESSGSVDSVKSTDSDSPSSTSSSGSSPASIIPSTPSSSSSGKAKDKKALCKVYYEVVQQLMKKQGDPRTVELSGGATGDEGVCLVELVDFDKDGADELVVGYYDKDKVDSSRSSNGFADALAYRVEVWGFKSGKAEKIHEQAADYSNGGFAYLVLDERADDIVMENYVYGTEDGSSTLTHSYYGFKDSKFGELGTAKATGLYTANNEYFIDGKEATKTEYEGYSDKFLGKHKVVCYQFMTASSSTPVDDRTSYTATQVVSRAKDTIKALKDGMEN